MICSGLSRIQSNSLYLDVLNDNDINAMRDLCKEDLFFLLTVGCKRKDINKDWLYERCREVESSPDGHLDLWAREHYKSTIITYGQTIKDILSDPNNTFGIFSHTRGIAKGFLSQIMREFEDNTFLKDLFPDILFQNPRKEAMRWSLDHGIIVKRDTNPKESTIEAWGLVDGQPTSKHFKYLIYDDVVTVESVTTPDQINKTTSAWEMSLNLGASGGKKRYIGTRYHASDTYQTMMERGSVKPRIYAATVDGKIDGEPIFLSKEDLMEKRRDMGPYTFGSQMLQNPVADKAMGFHESWPQFYESIKDLRGWNIYIFVDPANEKKKTNDFTVMAVIGLAPDQNYYLIDGVRDRLNLTERTEKVFEFVMKYNPIKVIYEKYGLQSDDQHIQYVMEQKNYRFQLDTIGGNTPKVDRIKRLIPIFEQKRFYLPKTLHFVDADLKSRDFTKELIEDEYKSFPVSKHDDMLDCIARCVDPNSFVSFPKSKPTPKAVSNTYQGDGAWMG